MLSKLLDPKLLACPCGAFAAFAGVGTWTGQLGQAGLDVALGYYLLLSGLVYMTRLLVHVGPCGYVCLRPAQHKRPRRRQELNFLTSLNAFTVIGWLALAVLLISGFGSGVSLFAKSACAVVFYAVVILLAGKTASCVKELKLKRGAEWLCSSWVGRVFEDLTKGVPDESFIKPPIDVLSKVNPRRKASALLATLATFLLAVPAGALSAEFARTITPVTPSEKSTEVPRISPAEVVTVPSDPGPTAPTGEAATATPPAASTPYEIRCPGFAVPGDPAPSPQREQLHALWLGGAGISGAGADVAGCALPAQPVSGRPQVWTARGICGSSLRSLGVAAPRYLPALLFEQAAEFALAKAREGDLLGASSRWTFEDGDAYVVDTEIGSFVLIRSDTGSEETGGGELPCESFTTGDAPFTIVPPGLIGLWLEIGQEGWVWPASVPSGEAGVDEFIFRPAPGTPTAGERPVEARCYSEVRCAAWFDGILRATSGPKFTSINAIASMTD